MGDLPSLTSITEAAKLAEIFDGDLTLPIRLLDMASPHIADFRCVTDGFDDVTELDTKDDIVLTEDTKEDDDDDPCDDEMAEIELIEVIGWVAIDIDDPVLDV